jgi:hypothetical protein
MQADVRFAVSSTVTRRARLSLGLLLLSALLFGGSAGAIPPELTYQAYLETTDGTPVDGSRKLTFSLYDPTGRMLWQENQVVMIDEGVFTAVLGSDPDNRLDGGQFRLPLSIGVQVGNEPELPRQPLATAPYAFRAQSVELDQDTLATLGCPNGQMAVRRGGAWTCGAVTTDLLAPDFTLDVSQLTGLLGEGYSTILPDVIDNTVLVEVSGTAFADEVIVTTGPGIEIERIPGFRPDGKPLDSPGPSVELPFVFEYAGPQAAALQSYHDDFVSGGVNTSISAIVKDLGGAEVFRWELLEYGLTEIEPGLDGRQRYVFRSQDPPDNVLRIQRSLQAFPSDDSLNPATDTRVGISGVVTGSYPVVEDDPANRTVTMTFDYVEGGQVFSWVRDTAQGSGPLHTRRVTTTIDEQGGVEVGRTNCFESFPIRYEQFTGFGQVEKIKERVVIGYGWCEPG